MSDARAKTLWDAIVAKIKESELDPPLWRALDAAVPIALEGQTLVVGFEPAKEHELAFLGSAQAQAALQRVLGTVATRPVGLLPIDGTSAADYERYRERERLRAEATARETAAREADDTTAELPFSPPLEGAGSTGSGRYLQELVLDLRHRYIKLPNRTTSYVKASFLHEIMPDLVKAEIELKRLEPSPEAFLRSAARLIDRVAEMLGVDSFVVALEFKRYRREHARD